MRRTGRYFRSVDGLVHWTNGAHSNYSRMACEADGDRYDAEEMFVSPELPTCLTCFLAMYRQAAT